MKRLFLSFSDYISDLRLRTKQKPSLAFTDFKIEEVNTHVQLDQTLSFELRTTQTRINAPLPHRPFLLSFRPVPLPPG